MKLIRMEKTKYKRRCSMCGDHIDGESDVLAVKESTISYQGKYDVELEKNIANICMKCVCKTAKKTKCC